jgi:hypothetical protein
MLQVPGNARSAPTDLGSRRQLALDRIHELIAHSQERAARAWRNYYLLQGLTVGLAAITPCLIVLAKEAPNNGLLNWLQLFFPAVAAICAGLSHIFRWREDAVRYASLAETIRSQLWRFQTRAGEFSPALSDDDALDRLVIRVDDLNLQSISRWSAAQLAEASGPASGAKPAPATTDH